MSYSLVSKSKYKPYKLLWDEILKKMQKELRKNKKITMEIFLTGSGKGKYLTQDEKGFFDLDYNLLIHKLPDEYRNNPQKLKDVIRTTIDRIKKESYGKYDISFGKDSTVPITYMLKERKKPVMGVDVAIITENPKTGNAQRLIHKKKNGENLFIWNEAKYRHSDLKEKLKIINSSDPKLKNDLDNRYLKKKDSNNQNQSSCIMFYETVNEVLNLSKKEVKTVRKVSGNNHTKEQMNHHANQKNSNNSSYRAAQNNRSNQLNPNNAQYKGGNSTKSGK